MSRVQLLCRCVVVSHAVPLQPPPVVSWMVRNAVSVAEPKLTDAQGTLPKHRAPAPPERNHLQQS